MADPTQAVLEAIRVVALPDETGLGLLRFGVEPDVGTAWLSQQLEVPGIPLSLTDLPPPLQLGTLTELLGVTFTATWQTLDQEPPTVGGG